MLHKNPSPAVLKKARIKTIEKELKGMLEQEFLKRRHFNDTYSPYMAEKILQVGEQGGGRSQMMKAIEVKTVKTFTNWLEDHQDFADAYELAQIYCQAYLEEQILEKATGKNSEIDIKALSLLMSSRFPEYKKELNGNKTEITINNSVERMDNYQLDEQIKRLTREYGFNNIEAIEGECVAIVSE